MEHLTIANFKFGLDTRRSELTSQPGSLVTAENGHINQGAQFEKRKAYVLLGQLPVGTFGLQETPTGILTFGSAATAAIPAGLTALVTYQRLRHFLFQLAPLGPPIQPTDSALGFNPKNTNEPQMTGIIASCSFGGQPFAVASFAPQVTVGVSMDDLLPITTCYYAGSPVKSSIQGINVLATASGAISANNYYLALFTTWIVQQNLDSTFSVGFINGGATGEGVSITGPLNSPFAVTVNDSFGGALGTLTQTQAAAPVVAFSAIATIYFTKGAAGSVTSITVPNVVNGAVAGALSLLTAPVPFATSLLQTAMNVATAINNAGLGYSAQASLMSTNVAALAISAPTTFGALVNSNNVTINTTTILTSSTSDSGSGGAGVKNYALNGGVTGVAGTGQVQILDFSANPSLSSDVSLFSQYPVGWFEANLVFNNAFTTLGAGYLTRKRASFVFFLVSGAAGSVDSILLSDGTNLLSAAVPFSVDLLTTVVAIVSNINAKWGGAGNHPATPISWGAYAVEIAGVAGVVVLAPSTSGENLNGQHNITINSTTIQVSDKQNGLTFGTTQLVTSLDGGNVDPTCATSLGGKLYLGRGSIVNFCASYDATGWEQQDVGAGFIRNTDQDTAPTGTIAMCPYQGKLAAFSRRNISIWNVNADPAQYSVAQNLKNIGAVAALGVQPIGDLDVLFLSDTGIRSLRVRDSTLNAYVVDVGSPIDDLIQTALLSGNGPSACSIVEPTSNRYWLYLNGVIYVFSYFPSLKILAWSTYLPTYDNGTGTQVAFTPAKFLVFNGQVYVYTTDRKVLVYGGANNNTYDGSIATIELPWLDAKTPFVIKQGEAVNVAMAGKWNVFCALDPRGGNLIQVVPNAVTGTGDETKDSTFDEGVFSFASQQGTHYKFKAQTTADWKQPATMSSFTLQYSKGENQ